ncbi:DUF3916 domain-containing protein [Rossellomorea vietnamensis]|uniref:DUF3916 domain-containing protein n=1 Tax=Rossellomorea vietnamensis TaxID=218284 RepID=UPI001E561DA8|nr:DUF3916 domain-containing protein [Rossellomorea vietnamensis]MCC5800994.1 DUF3916 domain-containing protein [Rossellomorea vietnamensis]
MRNKKIRGLKRRTDSMVKRIVVATKCFPTQFIHGYWHLPMPAGRDFISSGKTPFKIKRLCVQTLLDRAGRLSKLKTEKEMHTRVIVMIDPSDLWNSHIIVFNEEDAFKAFFERNFVDQKWIPQVMNVKLLKRWGIKIPRNLESVSYLERILDEDIGYRERELWFFGEFT